MTKTFNYTDKEGFQVTLTDLQVITLVKFAQEIRKTSPSNRLSRPTLKSMIQMSDLSNVIDVTTLDQGFFSCLNYWERKFIEEEDENDSPVDAIRNKVGEMALEKRAMSNENRKINKLKREISDNLLLFEDIQHSIENIDLTPIPAPKAINLQENSPYEAIIVPSDWHVGLMVDQYGKETQYERIMAYVEACIQYIRLFGIKKVTVVDLGDIIENGYLHVPTSTATCWTNNTEQFATYVKWMFEFISVLSEEVVVDYLGIIAGNHDRLQDKGMTLMGDSYSGMAEMTIASMLELQNNPNVNIIKNTDGPYLRTVNVKGKEFAFVHGDLEKKDGAQTLQKYQSILNRPIDFLIKGHTHSYKVETESHGKMIITSGTLNDANDYARSLGYYSTGSQLMLVVNQHTVQPLNIALGGIN